MTNRDNIDSLIVSLIIIKEFSKDIHYSCIGFEAYSWHLLADRVQENLGDYIDRLKEYLLGIDEKPWSSKEYLITATSFIPKLEINTISNFKKLQEIINKTLNDINKTQLDKAGDNLVSEIADNIRNSNGIINLVIS